MLPKKPVPNPGIPLRDPRDHPMFGPLSPDSAPLPAEATPRRSPRRDPAPDLTQRTTPVNAPLPRRNT